MVGINQAFDGARVLVTGATGFLGTALVEKILRSLPGVAEILLLVRSRPGASAAERVERRVLGSNAFDALRASAGWTGLASKVTAADGDMRSERLGLSPPDLERLRGVDYVLHCAAAVSFDAPVDEAFETNLAGPLRLLDALEAAGADPRRVVHVSTAYVSGLTRGTVSEVPWTDTPGVPRIDWRAELQVARTARTRVEEESRAPERLTRFARDARREVAPAGAPAVATRAEQLRRDWVTSRLVEMGRSRAQALGWPDAYAFTKALAESALAERARSDFAFGSSSSASNATDPPEQVGSSGDAPRPEAPRLVVLRPSIIESALREPSPGWIRGFRMADPIIIAYGRGQLSEFPGLPDTVVDVVPVDLVVNAMLALAAADDPPRVVHVATGNRNPMRYRDLVRWTHEYFQREPYLDEDGQPIYPELWTFPGRGPVMARLKWGTRALRTASRVLDHIPRSRVGDAAERVENRLEELEQAGRYAELYGAYAEVQTVFDDTTARALHEQLSPEDRETFGFDPTAVDWKTYLQELHLPEVTRRRAVVRRRPRPSPVSRVPAPSSGSGSPSAPVSGGVAGRAPHLAVFDLEGTVLGTNVVDTYLFIRLAASPRSEWARRMAGLAAHVPGFLWTDRRDRAQFLRNFYRRYEDAPVAEVAERAREAFDNFVLPRCFPDAIRRIREHRAAGHLVVFLTGALDFTVAPLAPLAHEVSAARLEAVDGRYTGDLVQSPLAGDARAVYLRRVAARHGADLRASYAYGDSISDLPMLESVGRPVVVNPDARLARIARRRRWPVERWRTEASAARFRFPEVVGS